MTLYEQVGSAFIKESITEFYKRAFQDGIIGHFFFGKDREHITNLQIDFATAALGGPRNYRGKSLVAAHRNLKIKGAHFGRRQVLMGEVLLEMGLDESLRQQWLALENDLKPLIMGLSPL
jgi:hemoglobin